MPAFHLSLLMIFDSYSTLFSLKLDTSHFFLSLIRTAHYRLGQLGDVVLLSQRRFIQLATMLRGAAYIYRSPHRLPGFGMAVIVAQNRASHMPTEATKRSDWWDHSKSKYITDPIPDIWVIVPARARRDGLMARIQRIRGTSARIKSSIPARLCFKDGCFTKGTSKARGWYRPGFKTMDFCFCV